MLNPTKIVKDINKNCKELFTLSTFYFHPSSTNRFRTTGDNVSKALNNYNNTSIEIDVVKWFDDFWMFAEIRFENQNTFVSVSVFQGDEKNKIKHQLFRAEWDDYNTKDLVHPQPHWHITANQVIEKTFLELASMDNSDTFLSLLNEEKSSIIDINKIHFAMCGNWMNNETHTHLLDHEDKIVKWFQGLFVHIKTQLEYAKI